MDKSEILESEIDEQIENFKVFPNFKDEDEVFFNKVKAMFTSRVSIKLEKGSLLDNSKHHKKWFVNKKRELDMRYWDRYRKYLIYDKGFSIDVVNKMDDILDSITDLVGNPDSDTDFQRRGLVIGDVQSGKTANYTGLICKAADANCKVVVLLTGTIEKLRQQTQKRLDEGFVGLDSSALIKDLSNIDIGVSNYDKSVKVVVLTSTMDDFKSKTAQNLGFDLKSLNSPVLFVVKKNVAVLKRLNKWLCTFNQNGEEPIDHSLLLIDDEADNASVNTNKEDKDPTKINEQIRGLLAAFKRSSYCGFTATPFANIFIDPNTKEQMENEDLFPKDYIYSLNPPSNYIGARNIFGDEGEYSNICKVFSLAEEDEIEDLIPMKHKKDHIIDGLPSTLNKAIQTFLLANVIRDLRGDDSKHRSMLVNVSRFTDIQMQLGTLINSELKSIQNSARLYSKSSQKQAMGDIYMRRLHKLYEEEFYKFGYSWNEVKENLYKGIGNIKVIVINQRSADKLDYEEYEEGLRVITVGGLSLSRGLTLEGLMTSYLYRSTRMYDTLLQMGRWFGYRPNYADLCSIWLTETSREWYNHISEASDELRSDLKRYEDTGLTPLDFGIRVRSDKNALLVTARNKMRTSEKRNCTISLSEEAIETTDLYIEEEKNNTNERLVKNLINRVKSCNIPIREQGRSYVYKNVDKEIILDLLNMIEMPASNEYLDPPVISKFISKYEGDELEKWDIGFANGSDDETYEIETGCDLKYITRSFSVIGNNEDIVRMSGKSRRLGNVGDGKLGIDIDSSVVKKTIFDIENRFGIHRVNPRNLKQKDYFTKNYIGFNRNPLLMIYNVKLKYDPEKHVKKTSHEKKLMKEYASKKTVGIGIGIPRLSSETTRFATYAVNRIYQELENEYDLGDEE